MVENKSIGNPVWLTGKLDDKWTAEFIDYLYDCKSNEKDAILFVVGELGGNLECLLNIADTLKCTGVKLTTIGYGNINPIATALFCQGDERILIPGSQIVLTQLGNGCNNLYMEKTMVNQAIFDEKTICNLPWFVDSTLWSLYSFITKEYVDFWDVILTFYNEVNIKIPCYFVGELNAKTTKEILEHIYACAASKSEVFLEINSSGGDAYCLASIISTIELTKVRVTTIGGGRVASAAAELFLMGDRRILKDNALLLIHEGHVKLNDSKLFACTASDMAKRMEETNIRCKIYCTQKTKLTIAELTKYISMGRDWIVDKKEIKKFAFTTHTYEEILQEIIKVRRKS